MGIAERLQRWLWIKPIPRPRHNFSSNDKEVLLPFRKKCRLSQGIKFFEARYTKRSNHRDHIGIKEFFRKSCEKVRFREAKPKTRLLNRRKETQFYGLKYYSTTTTTVLLQSHYDQGYYYHRHGKRSAFHMAKHAKEKILMHKLSNPISLCEFMLSVIYASSFQFSSDHV